MARSNLLVVPWFFTYTAVRRKRSKEFGQTSRQMSGKVEWLGYEDGDGTL